MRTRRRNAARIGWFLVCAVLAALLPGAVRGQTADGNGVSIKQPENSILRGPLDKLIKNIEAAKELQVITEEEKKCICTLLGDAATDPPEGAPPAKFCAFVEPVPDGQEQTTPGWAVGGENVGLNLKMFGSKDLSAKEDGANGGKYTQPWLWILAAVLAHEKEHYDRPNSVWNNEPPGGGPPVIVDHTEHRAYCRSVKALKAALALNQKDYDAGKITKAQYRQTKVVLTGVLETHERFKDGFKSGTKESDIPEEYRRKKPKDEKKDKEKKIDEGDGDPPPAPPAPPLDDDDGKYAASGGYTLRCDEVSYEYGTSGKYGVDGLAPEQPYVVGLTPLVAGAYDDGDLVILDCDTPLIEVGEQAGGFVTYGMFETTVVRLSAFVWPIGTVIDWYDPDLTSASRIDIDGIGVYDTRTATNGAGHALSVDSRFVVEGADVAITFSGPASTPVSVYAQRSQGIQASPPAQVLLGTWTADAAGSLDETVTLPAKDQYADAGASIELDAQCAGESTALWLSVRPALLTTPERGGLFAQTAAGETFGISMPTIERALEVEQADLGFVFIGFEENASARVYATRIENEAYDDGDAVELTSGAQLVGGGGSLYLKIPCTYADGQAYRLTGIVWPPGVAPNQQNLPLATRLDLVDILPLFPVRVPEDSDEFAAEPFRLAVSDVWARSEQALELDIEVADFGQDAQFSATYETAVEGTFSGTPVTIGSTVTLAPGDDTTIQYDAPQVTEPTVLRIEVTFESPTGQFATETKVIAVAVFPPEQS